MKYTAKPLFVKNKIRRSSGKSMVFINKPSPTTVTAPVSELNKITDYKNRLNMSAAKIKQLHNDLTTTHKNYKKNLLNVKIEYNKKELNQTKKKLQSHLNTTPVNPNTLSQHKDNKPQITAFYKHESKKKDLEGKIKNLEEKNKNLQEKLNQTGGKKKRYTKRRRKTRRKTKRKTRRRRRSNRRAKRKTRRNRFRSR